MSYGKNVLLAEQWDESVDPTGWWISEKLDGMRAYWTGKSFYSRQGNPVHAPKWWTKDLPSVPLDGELWCGRGLFQKCVSIVKQQKDSTDDDWKFITYLVFDAPTHAGKYEERVDFLKTHIKSEKQTTYAAVVGIKKCQGVQDLKKCLDDVIQKGGEGVMLRQPGSLYVNGRSSTLLKVKQFYDDEALVVGYKPGKGRLQGTMGGLECKLPNGVEFTIGTGFSDAQRHKPPKKGSVVSFKFQELSNSGTPRFPVYLRERTDMTWKDVLENAKTKISPALKQKIIPSLKKQHSIMFSTVPSRDQETGEKIVTPDDVHSDDEVDKKEKDEKKKEPCKYGASCYRQDPGHQAKFFHEPRVAKGNSQVLPAKSGSKAIAAPAQTPCKFGAECYRQDEIHTHKYSHPVRVPLSQEKEESDDEAEPEAEEETITVSKKEWDQMQQKLKEQNDRLAALEKGGSQGKAEVVDEKMDVSTTDDSTLAVCIYGENCTRTNPDHFKQFAHPNAPNKKRKVGDLSSS